jgi:hypothetical protein
MACLVDETIIERNIDQSINLEELPAGSYTTISQGENRIKLD